jgi:ferritin-like metal-binding protein YciE
MMKLMSLEELLADESDELKDLYSAENQLVKALPKMAKATESDDLRKAFEHHLEQTRNQVRRIEQICNELSVKPGGKKCVAMEGLIEEGKEILSADAEPEILDAALIGAAQKVEHYEISAYGTARAHAKQLGFMRAADLLGETLSEEEKADEKLTMLAENMVNVQAAMSKGM